MSYSTLKLFPACNIKVDYEEENRKSFYLSDGFGEGRWLVQSPPSPPHILITRRYNIDFYKKTYDNEFQSNSIWINWYTY